MSLAGFDVLYTTSVCAASSFLVTSIMREKLLGWACCNSLRADPSNSAFFAGFVDLCTRFGLVLQSSDLEDMLAVGVAACSSMGISEEILPVALYDIPLASSSF